MKTKQLLLIPALLIAMLCMATKCKVPPGADVVYQIYLTNKSTSNIECTTTNVNGVRVDVIGIRNRELVTTVGFAPDDPTKEISANFKLSNAKNGSFIDTTLTFKHLVLKKTKIQVEMTVNANLTLTIVEKPY